MPGAVRGAWPPATSKSKPLPAGGLLVVREVTHFQRLHGLLRDLGREDYCLCAPVSSGACFAGPELDLTLCYGRLSLPCDFYLHFHSVQSPANCVTGPGFSICEEAVKTRLSFLKTGSGAGGGDGQLGPTEMWMRLMLLNRTLGNGARHVRKEERKREDEAFVLGHCDNFQMVPGPGALCTRSQGVDACGPHPRGVSDVLPARTKVTPPLTAMAHFTTPRAECF